MTITGVSPIGLVKKPYPGFTEVGGIALDEANWDNAKVLKNVESGNELTTARLPPGTWILFAKHIDTSLNYSAVAAKTQVTVENNNDIIYETEHEPRWSGTISGFVRHFVSGKLIPQSAKLAAELTKEELFEQFVPYPVPESSYVPAERDFGFDATQLRIWADMSVELGRGQSGVPDPQLFIDYRASAGGYGGFQSWTIGRINAAAVKFKIVLNHTANVSSLAGLKTVIDAVERTEKFPDEIISVGGTVINFANRFITNPNISISPADTALIPYYTNKTTQSVRIFLKTAAGTDVGGVADIEISGA